MDSTNLKAKSAHEAVKKNIAILEQGNEAMESLAASLFRLNQLLRILLKKCA